MGEILDKLRREAMRLRIEAAKSGELQVSPESARRVAAANRMAERQFIPPIEKRPADSTLAVAPGTTPEMARNIPEGMVYDPKTGGYADVGAMAERSGTIPGLLASFTAGGPFAGEYADELVGALGGEIPQELMRAQREKAQREHPFLAGASEFAGGVVGTLPIAALAGPAKLVSAMPGGATTIGRGILATLGGAFASGIEGAVSGYGAGETPQERLTEAGTRGALGAGLGGFLGLGGRIAGDLGSAAMDASKKMFRGDPISNVSEHFGVDKNAAAMLLKLYNLGDEAAIEEALQKMGRRGTMADVNEAVRGTVDVAFQAPGVKSVGAKRAIKGSVEESYTDLTSAMDTAFATKPTFREQTLRALAEEGRRSADNMLGRVYATPIDWGSPAGKRLKETLRSVPPEVWNAVDRRIRTKLPDFDEFGNVVSKRMSPIGMRFDEAGIPVMDDEMLAALDMGQVHMVAKTISKMINETKVGALGGLEGQMQDLANLNRAIRNEMKGTSKTFEEWSGAFSDLATQAEAIDFGYDALRSGKNFTKDKIKAGMDGYTGAAEKEAVYKGVRTYIDNVLSKAKVTTGKTTEELAEAQKALSALNSREVRDKLTIILGEDRAKQLFKSIDAVQVASRTQADLARGAQTAGRVLTAEELKKAGGASVPEEIISAALEPGGRYSMIARAFSKDPKYIQGQNEKFLQQVMDSLTRAKSQDQLAADIRRLSSASADMFTEDLTGAEAKKLAAEIWRLQFYPTTGLLSANAQERLEGPR